MDPYFAYSLRLQSNVFFFERFGVGDVGVGVGVNDPRHFFFPNPPFSLVAWEEEEKEEEDEELSCFQIFYVSLNYSVLCEP